LADTKGILTAAQIEIKRLEALVSEKEREMSETRNKMQKEIDRLNDLMSKNSGNMQQELN